jgi:hypothetical protein
MSDKDSKHTPGPLTIRRSMVPADGAYDWAILDADNKVIGETFGRVGLGDYRPAEDNARLFRAAPDLLAAVRELAREVRRCAMQGYTGTALLIALTELAEVIAAKAEGRTTEQGKGE